LTNRLIFSRKAAEAQRRNYNYCFFTLKAPGTEEGDKVRTLEGV